jgi:pyruvate-formate lyase-activating enzyme
MVATVNMNEAHYRGIAEVYHRLTRCEGVDLLAYHAYGGGKWKAMGCPDGGCPAYIPTAEALKTAAEILTSLGVSVTIYRS